MLDHVWKGILGATLVAVLAGGGTAAARSDREGDGIFEFEHLTGVPRPFAGPTAAANAIRGVPGGGLPWVIGKGEAKLASDGLLTVEVEGLVFDPADPVVIERGLAGRNTVPGFKAIVSCRTVEVVDGSPVATFENVETAVFPATQEGDAFIEQHVSLPDPCIAPIVFVTSPAGAWFAASGAITP